MTPGVADWEHVVREHRRPSWEFDLWEQMLATGMDHGAAVHIVRIFSDNVCDLLHFGNIVLEIS